MSVFVRIDSEVVRLGYLITSQISIHWSISVKVESSKIPYWFVVSVGLGVWIGLNDLSEQMSFAWADGAPVLATFWMHSEPNNWIGKNEDCVEAISYKEVQFDQSYLLKMLVI